jgi:hypothetical protein
MPNMDRAANLDLIHQGIGNHFAPDGGLKISKNEVDEKSEVEDVNSK